MPLVIQPRHVRARLLVAIKLGEQDFARPGELIRPFLDGENLVKIGDARRFDADVIRVGHARVTSRLRLLRG